MRLQSILKKILCTHFQWKSLEPVSIPPSHADLLFIVFGCPITPLFFYANNYNTSVLTLLEPDFTIYLYKVIPISFFVLRDCQFWINFTIYVFSCVFTTFAVLFYINKIIAWCYEGLVSVSLTVHFVVSQLHYWYKIVH